MYLVVVVLPLFAPKQFLCPAVAPLTPWYGQKGGAWLLDLLVAVTARMGWAFGSKTFSTGSTYLYKIVYFFFSLKKTQLKKYFNQFSPDDWGGVAVH